MTTFFTRQGFNGSTFHCVLPQQIYSSLEEPTEKEEACLDLVPGLTETSRLGCKVSVHDGFEGAVIDLPANTINYEDGFLPSHKPDDAPLVSDRSKSELHDKVPLDRACLLRPIYILQYSSSFFIIKNSKSRVNARFPVVCFTIFATCTSMLLYFKYIWQTCTVHMDMIPNREWTHSLSLAKIVENASFDVANAIIFEKSTECVEGDVF